MMVVYRVTKANDRAWYCVGYFATRELAVEAAAKDKVNSRRTCQYSLSEIGVCDRAGETVGVDSSTLRTESIPLRSADAPIIVSE